MLENILALDRPGEQGLLRCWWACGQFLLGEPPGGEAELLFKPLPPARTWFCWAHVPGTLTPARPWSSLHTMSLQSGGPQFPWLELFGRGHGWQLTTACLHLHCNLSHWSKALALFLSNSHALLREGTARPLALFLPVFSSLMCSVYVCEFRGLSLQLLYYDIIVKNFFLIYHFWITCVHKRRQSIYFHTKSHWFLSVYLLSSIHANLLF